MPDFHNQSRPAVDLSMTRVWQAQRDIRAALAAGDEAAVEKPVEVLIAIGLRTATPPRIREACVRALTEIHTRFLLCQLLEATARPLAQAIEAAAAKQRRRPGAPVPLTAALIKRELPPDWDASAVDELFSGDEDEPA